MTDISHLKRLETVKSNGGVKLLTPSAFPGSHCPMHTALSFAGAVKGLSTLLVGTRECATYSRIVIPKAEGDGGELHWVYTLDDNEVVFGCHGGLISAIKKMEQSGAKAILLIVTCVPELIGEDIEGLLYELQPEVKPLLAFVLMGHFKCNSYPSGFWKTILALGALLKPVQHNAEIVNILGRSPDEDHIPLPTLFSALIEKGLKFRFIGPGICLEDFLQAPDGALNLVVSPYMLPLAQLMEKEFNIPYISLHNLYGPSQIDETYGKIEVMLNISLKDELSCEREIALELQDLALKRVSGLTYVSAQIGAVMVLPLANYLGSLGMSPLLLHIEEWYPEDKQWSRQLIEQGIDPPVCHMVNNGPTGNIIEALGPDLYLGMLPDCRISSVPNMQEIYGYIGYERTIELLRKILRALDDNALKKGDD